MNWGCKPIPLEDAALIGARHGYDQVIVIARKCGERGAEYVTAWGATAEHQVAARKGADIIKYRVMGWKPYAASINQNVDSRGCAASDADTSGSTAPDNGA
jgi:hypothetical protein